ncbi:PIG-L deacetylase family protein [Patescibacteria group bacterium]
MIKKLPGGKKIAFFSPHPDDDVIASGALLHELGKRENQILIVCLTNSPRVISGPMSKIEKIALRQKETRAACRVIGTKPLFLNLEKPDLENKRGKTKIKKFLEEEKPDIIFVPPSEDVHPTHQKVTKLVLENIGQASSVKQVWFFDGWTPLPAPNYIFFFSEKEMAIKKEAVTKHVSQHQRLNFFRAAKGLNIFRGEMGKELMAGFGASSSLKSQYGEAYLVKNI